MFSSDFIKSICLNQDNSALDRIPEFHNVNDMASFKIYLNDIPDLYSKLCLWSIEHTFPLGKTAAQVNHHLMPKFLCHDYSYGFTKKQIENSYNIASINWFIHFLMHLTRLVEYGQVQDELALKIITKHRILLNL